MSQRDQTSRQLSCLPLPLRPPRHCCFLCRVWNIWNGHYQQRAAWRNVDQSTSFRELRLSLVPRGRSVQRAKHAVSWNVWIWSCANPFQWGWERKSWKWAECEALTRGSFIFVFSTMYLNSHHTPGGEQTITFFLAALVQVHDHAAAFMGSLSLLDFLLAVLVALVVGLVGGWVTITSKWW